MEYTNWNFNIQQLPPELYNTIVELEHERANHGVESTPDETSDTIEQLFLTLGRLYLAELWCATINGSLSIQDRVVLDLLLDSRDASLQGHLTMGRWVGLSRKISSVFKQNNLRTNVLNLDTVDWGNPGETHNVVNQLIEFRNRFAHGSFSAPKDIIETHYQLLIQLIKQVTGLYTQQIVAYAPQLGIPTPITWTEGNAQSTTAQPPEDKDNTVYIQTNTTWMSLSPFFDVAKVDDALVLVLSDFSKINVADLFNFTVLSQWQSRYSQEYSGNIDRTPNIAAREASDCPKELQTVVLDALNKHIGKTTQIIGYPGTGLDSILPFMHATSPAFDHVVFWDVQPGDLTQSANVLLNKLEQLLNVPPPSSKRPTLNDRIELLEQALTQSSVLLLVDGTEFAAEHYRREPYTVLDILNQLVECSLTTIIVSLFSDQRNQLFYDEQVLWEKTNIVNTTVLRQTIERLHSKPLHKQILQVLKEHTCTLFALCDQLDTLNETTVFEPEVEYALWHLRPLLKTDANTTETGQTERVWTVFSNEVTL